VTWKLSAALVAALAAPAFAQEAPGGDTPPTTPAAEIPTSRVLAKRAVAPARRVVLPPLDPAPLLAEDDEKASIPALKSDPRVGVVRKFRELRAPRRLTAGARGVETLADGSLLWAAEVSAPGAVGVRLHVSRCDLPDGATLVVFDADEPKEAYGPFRDRGPFDSGEFLLPTVFGETARVEIRVPAASAGHALRFSADRLAHRYRERGEGFDDPRVGPTAKAGSCNNNVACDASFEKDVARAVATMEITASDGVYLCSGTLLDDSRPRPKTDIPYFLTAHHCISSASEAQNTEFYFDYRAASCTGSPPPLSSVPRVSSSTLLATGASSDFTLLKLVSFPANDSVGRYLCKWTATRPPAGESIVGVHHPGGGQMRISYGTFIEDTTVHDFDSGADIISHSVQWTSGVTAGGSSGSALFNSAKQVIGQLWGGDSSCAAPSGIDYYGRFDRSYNSLSPWLGSGADGTIRDSFDPADDTAAGAIPLASTYQGVEHGPHTLSKDDLADWFSFVLETGGRYRFFSTGADDVKATLYSVTTGLAVAADDGSAGPKQFSVDYTAAATGTYRLKVETAAAAGSAEYTLEATRVDLAQTRTPAAVSGLKRSIAGSTVTLRWKDRAHNEAGYYVDVSEDGGANWSRVAELPRNARRLVVEPGPGSHLYRVGAWNATAEVNWRRVAAEVEDPERLDPFDSADDDGSGATALTPATGGSIAGRTLSRADFEDWFKIQAVAGTTYEFTTTGTLDSVGDLFGDSFGATSVAHDDDGGAKRNFKIVFSPTSSRTYWLRVSAYQEGDVGAYSLSWSTR
jgi:hypothetical protein